MMKQRSAILVQILLVMLASAGMASCSRQGDKYLPTADSEFVPVQMALSLGGGLSSTKADVGVIPELNETGVFSGMNDVCLIPIVEGKTFQSFVISLPNIEANGQAETSAYLYSGDFFLPIGTHSALVYGHAPSPSGNDATLATKHRYGSLAENDAFVSIRGNHDTQVSALGFVPETISTFGNTTPPPAQSIAEILSAIVQGESFEINAYYDINSVEQEPVKVSIPWNGSIGEANLKKCYEDFTEDGALMSGSGENTAAMLTNLYRNLSGYLFVNPDVYEVEVDGTAYEAFKKVENERSKLTYADLYNGVRNVILGRFKVLKEQSKISIADDGKVSFVSEDLSSYPESLGLPSGAAVVHWTPTGFKVPVDYGTEGIAPISAYCYPPSLYYFANSSIKTSNVAVEAFTPGKDWPWVLENTYTDDVVVSRSTSAVAIADSLQYAVGMLKATLKASSAKLQDNDGLEHTLVDVSGNNFPLTGIIIGRQYPVRYDFAPIFQEHTETTPESTQYFLYDNQFSGVVLGTEKSAFFRALSLETPENKEVYFALEFRNDSGSSFYGAEGRIWPGHKFYLTGKLDGTLKEGEAPLTSYQVIKRDHVTEVNCVVKTLKNAHSAVPDLGIPQLNLGVQVQVNWVMSTPTDFMFE